MILRNILAVFLCVVAAVGIGSMYQSHAYLVWGLLVLCWVCYRIKMRAENIFGRRAATVSASLTAGEVRSEDSSLS